MSTRNRKKKSASYGSRRRRTSKPKSYNSTFGYQTALGFRWNAQSGIEQILSANRSANNPDDFQEKIRGDRGRTVATAINLSLAAELSMKSILAAYKLKIPRTHDLYKLYVALPPDLRCQLSPDFVRLKANNMCVISLGRGPTASGLKNSKEPDDPLEAAMMRSRNTFDDFRFVYELNGKSEVADPIFYFSELRFMVDLLLSVAKQFFDKDGFTIVEGECDLPRVIVINGLADHGGLTGSGWGFEAACRLSDAAFHFSSNHKILKSTEDQEKYCQENYWRLPAAAVGITLGIEMFLKSILINLNLPHDNSSHDLWKCFDNLPESVQARLRVEFDERLRNSDKGMNYEFCISSINAAEDEKWANLKPFTRDMSDILKRTSNHFIKWRYAYEMPSTANAKTLDVPIGYLCVLLESICLASAEVFKNPEDYRCTA